MRKVIFGINISIDGCCDHTKQTGGEDVHVFFAQLMQEADVLVYGRKTYELMVPFWPDMAKNQSGDTQEMNDFAKAFDSVGKIVVFSHTLQEAYGEKTTIVRTSPQAEISRLKQEEGGNILLGGVDLPSQLVESGLVDEFIVVVQPLVAGEGRRLFDTMSLPETLQLNLIESKVFPSGCVVLRYVKE
ncbi:dihydrofolate reductase family protein [Emticicia agri]|uniref:Dihydrofolate reductase n=1 Tax=Emticicia agri TaxID=2492393 RepID=A0A4Q5M5B5_9BACT|nr:dihydrofolate reductase family protein [Emticicia agri]RYU97113.1 dihydrofolate reductase [Emticicia agri]